MSKESLFLTNVCLESCVRLTGVAQITDLLLQLSDKKASIFDENVKFLNSRGS